MAQRKYEDFQIGQAIPDLSFDVDTLKLVKYCAASDDYARQHEFAVRAA